ncbi:MucBP domain protein [Enterococcus faecalis 13-SD-W-01]|nr:MucBP domain protein [Enterococcus faecalis 13-SD-W-01]
MRKKNLFFLILFLGLFFGGKTATAENLDFSVTLPQEVYQLDYTMPIAISIRNYEQESIRAGSKIVLEIPSELLNFNTLYLDSAEASLFKINTIPSQNKIELIVQKEIGRANINFTLFSRVRTLSGEYSISSFYQDNSGNRTVIMPNIKKITVVNEDVTFGLLNLYWGYEPTNTGTFLGKDPTAEDNVTGIFSNTTNEISNQININRGHTDSLKNDEHYIGKLELKNHTNSIIHFEEEKLRVTDLDTSEELPPNLYTVKIENNNTSDIKVTVDFNSPQQSNNRIQESHAYNIKCIFTVEDLKEIYESSGQVKIQNQTTAIKETNIFYLHSKFASPNQVSIFPIIKAENKAFDQGILAKTNLLELLLKNVSASDPKEGNLNQKIKVDYHNLLQVANMPGTYHDIVKYTVENSQGLTTEKSVSVTIKKLFGEVTIDYVDKNGEKIKNSNTIKGEVGTSYQITKPKITGWKVLSPPTNSKGIFSKSKQNIKIIYEKEPKKNHASVEIKNKNTKTENETIRIFYRDENGNNILKSKTITGITGTSYHVEPLKINGWEIKDIPKNYLGVFSSENKEITFVYKKIEFGSVIIHYFDEEGHKIKNDEKIKGQVGDPYDFTTKQRMKNMDIVKVIGNIKGNYQKKTTFITFYYKKSTGTVVIKFVDESGKEIAPPKYFQGNIGEKYSYIPKRTIFN